MFTLLTQLELGEVQYLRLLPQINITCSLNFHKVGVKFATVSVHPGVLLVCLHVLVLHLQVANWHELYRILVHLSDSI